MNWNDYLNKTKTSEPRPLLVEALKYVKNYDHALDLGCGAMNDTRELFKYSFKKVDAVDSNSSIGEIATDLINSGLSLKFYPVSFSEFQFSSKNYDLINAQFSLPFTSPDDFVELWLNLEKSLRENGVFVGQFFGNEDEWSTRPNMSFFTKDQVESLFNKDSWRILKNEEFKGVGKTASGNTKMWHVFHIIAIKHVVTNPDTSVT